MKRIVELSSGTLALEVSRAELPLDALCGFADRHNLRRGFLFVSKVLGKHYPVRPSAMDEVHRLIADRLDAAMPGPIAFLALAETAVGLGQSVYRAFSERSGREDAMFVHSTRYAVGEGTRLAFSEAHSHAPSHLLHVPVDPEVRALFLGARSVVVIDDEISTGNTLAATVEAYRAVNAGLERVTLCSITDWSGPAARARLLDRLGLPVTLVSVLEGTFAFTPRPRPAETSPPPRVELPFSRKDHVLPHDFGRLGVRALPAPGPVPDLGPTPRDVLVLGTGEFTYLPFELARALEARGHRVTFQSTTRSPIHVGHDIGAKLELIDNYFDGMPNFLYNVTPGAHEHVIACYETQPLPPEHALPRTLGAEVWRAR